MPRFAFEDFTPGFTKMLGPMPVSRDEIVAFAREYDPQPFHLDEVAAKESFMGTLIASGWHTCCLNMRVLADQVLLDSTALGAPGIEEVRWMKPVRPGDTLRSRMTVLDSRPSKSRPTMGLVRIRYEVLNQNDETVMTQANWIMFGRRDSGSSQEDQNGQAEPSPATGARAPAREFPTIASNLYFEDIVAGETDQLGSYTFEADDIIRFARQFDPQPFHVDPVAARKSLFGGLCASGWQTGSVWMRLLVDARQRIRDEALARGERAARLGPSPGFNDLKWSKPVYAGDTISYRSTLTGKRASASRPGWGLAFHRNVGVNQHGEEVFSFNGAVFWEKRPE